MSAGDVIGFVSRRSNMDFYHTGLIAFAKDGTLLLRHASQSRRRILDERMADFVAPQRRALRHPVASGRSDPCGRGLVAFQATPKPTGPVPSRA